MDHTTRLKCGDPNAPTVHRHTPPFTPAGGWEKFRRLFWLIFIIGPVGLNQAQTVPDLINYSFTVAETKTLPGTSSAPGAPCNGTIAPADQVQDLAIVALPNRGDCWTDGRYNGSNFKVDRGTLSGAGGSPLAAYRVYAPANKPTQFLVSRAGLYYRFPTVDNYTVYTFAGGALTRVANVPAAAIPNTTDFVQVTNASGPITFNDITDSAIYVVAPSATRLSVYTFLATGVEGGRIASSPLGDVLKYRYTVEGTPFDTTTSFSSGPGDWGNTYSDTRRFFPVRNGDALGVVWQNQADASLKLTWFGADRRSPTTVGLANPRNEGLACATGDDTGNVYYLTVQTGSGVPTTSRTTTLTKAGPGGAVLATAVLDASENALNMVSFGRYPASLIFLNGKLGLMMGRQMHRSNDGLNHQGGIAVVFDANTLAVDRNWGQTSGHSFDNVLVTNAKNEFVGIDLGDNFPRGVHLHKFTGTNYNSRVISTFKTAHGTTAQSPSGATYPVYAEISGGGTTYYRWSNDNGTYTELGGVEQTALGYTVTFAGERSAAGRLLDSSRVGGTLNDPRNVGLITVREDFQSATGGGAQVSDDLVLTPGLVETGQFYGFTGGLVQQRNAGVVWLTQYNNTNQNVSRLKMTRRADGNLLLLWEVWTPSTYIGTKAMTVTPNGTIVNAETDLTTLVRLGRRDDPIRIGNSICLISGKKDNTIELTVIEPGGPGAAPNVTVQPQPQTVTAGANASFTAAAIGTGPLAYQWRLNGQNLNDGAGINGALTATLSLQNVQLTQAGAYDVVIANALGRQTSNPAQLTVNAGGTAPAITAQPQPQTVTVGAAATFAVTANGTAPVTYQWRLNGQNLADGAGINGAQTTALALQNVQATQAGNYDVVIANNLGRLTSNPALLTVNAAGIPPRVVTQPQPQVIRVGADATFTVTAAGTEPLTYRWKFNSADVTDSAEIQGSQTATLTLRNVQANQAGNYTVAITNPFGNATSAAGALTVNPAPTLPVVVDVPPETPIDTGGDGGWIPETWDDAGGGDGFRPAGIGAGAGRSFYSRDGEDSARSAKIGDRQETFMEITVSGPAAVSFWWRVDSEEDYDFLNFEIDGLVVDRISGLVEWEEITVDVPAGDHALRWTYRKDEELSDGADAGWVDQIRVTTGEAPPTVAEVLGTEDLQWSTTGDQPWFVTPDPLDDTFDVVRSGEIADNQESLLETTVVGPADLTFWWRVDSEQGFDFLTFELDNVDALSPISGNLGWEQISVAIPPGRHQLRWAYRKDSTRSVGLDAGFVDDVTLTRPTPGQNGEAGPQLRFSVDGQRLRLSWPSTAAGFKLQSTASLSNPNWQDAPANSIATSGGEFYLNVNRTVGTRFYRLVKP